MHNHACAHAVRCLREGAAAAAARCLHKQTCCEYNFWLQALEAPYKGRTVNYVRQESCSGHALEGS